MSKSHEYLDIFKAQLEDWEYQFNRLEARVEDVQDEARDKLEETIKEFRANRKELQDKLAKFEDAAEDAWQDIKDGLELAWDSLKLGVLAARSEFMDKSSESEK